MAGFQATYPSLSIHLQVVQSKYDQELPQSQTVDIPNAL